MYSLASTLFNAWTALSLCTAVCATANANTIRISNYDDFSKFAQNVSAARGATVVLENDLDMSEMYTPIEGFTGTFDGQGHTLSNLNYYSNEIDMGLFSTITEGATIKNVILDKSCAFNCKSTTAYVYAGSIAGLCTAKSSRCAVLNTVSMAVTSYEGPYDSEEGSESQVSIGGLVGKCATYEYDCVFRNVVNYGNMQIKGDGSEGYMGGIAGYCEKERNGLCVIQNALNYGKIVYNGGSWNDVLMGGVLGHSVSLLASGCVNMGKVVAPEDVAVASPLFGFASGSVYVTDSYYLTGTCLAGDVELDNSVESFNESFMLDSVEEDSEFGSFEEDPEFGSFEDPEIGSYEEGSFEEDPEFGSYEEGSEELFRRAVEPEVQSSSQTSSEFTSNSQSSFSTSTSSSSSFSSSSSSSFSSIDNDPITIIDLLNNYVDSHPEYSLSKWILNFNSANVTFVANNSVMGPFDSKIILSPMLEGEGVIMFDGWYRDENLVEPLRRHKIKGVDNATLYGRLFESNITSTIFFNTTGAAESIEPITARAGTVVILPKNLTRQSYSFIKWADPSDLPVSFEYTVPAHNITLHAQWLITNIFSAADLVELARGVNELNLNYEGVTVSLMNDIDMGGIKDFDGIANSFGISFDGTFDGNGYTISNLVFTKEAEYAGLFGNSNKGVSIKNVVLDSTCSVNATIFDSYFTAGNILGTCYANDRNCEVSSVINMASITLTSEGESNSFILGGIVGSCDSYEVTACSIKNSVNYGDITLNGDASEVVIGGIAGSFGGYEVKSYVDNVLNYGSITYSCTIDTEQGTYIGGIMGTLSEGSVRNSVNMGRLTTTDGTALIEAIIGSSDSETPNTNCFWTSDGAGNSVSEGSSVLFDENFVLEDAINANYYKGNSLIAALNAYSAVLKAPRWVLNKDSKTISFVIGEDELVAYTSQIILLPTLAPKGEEASFDAWYTDSERTSLFAGDSVSADITLYGFLEEDTGVKNHTVSFDTVGGTGAPNVSAPTGTNITLPTSEREGFIFVGWFDNETITLFKGTLAVPNYDITLYAKWVPMTISTPEDYIDFIYGVNNGESCEGHTIKLANDLDLDGYAGIEPIGISEDYPFEGTFDGQSFRIKNLKITSHGERVGMFGVSVNGATFRNILLDKTCLFKSQGTYDTSLGSIIGKCTSGKRPCTVENSINMAPIEANAVGEDQGLYAGGILGEIYGTAYQSTVKNCANYGAITATGSFSDLIIGGIISGIDTDGTTHSILNCVNFGKITVQMVTSFIIVGGIVGEPPEGIVGNCANLGRIEYNISPEVTPLVGMITGERYDSTIFENCFWDTEAENGLKWNGEGTTVLSNESIASFTDFAISKDVISGKYRGRSLVDALNAYTAKNAAYDLSEWASNKDLHRVDFIVNGKKRGSFSSKLILFPELANYPNSERMYFDGWYTDSAATHPLDVYDIKTSLSLYGLWKANDNIYTVTFDVGDGDPIPPVSGYYGTAVALRDPVSKGGKGFLMWVDEKGAKVDKESFTIPAYNATLRAVWSITQISKVEDLMGFATAVSTGLNYRGMTVTLMNDLDMTELQDAFEPINEFHGVFEGNGHMIRGLKLNYTTELDSMGLFGYSYYGMTVRNLVMDASLVIQKTMDEEYELYAGSIMGSCYGSYVGDKCAIQDCVAMGSIRADAAYLNMYIGGLAGTFSGYEGSLMTIESSVSYMDMDIKSAIGSNTIGGIVGDFNGFDVPGTLRNNLNAMTLNFVETPDEDCWTDIGGIAGSAWTCTVTNCVSLTTIKAGLESKTVKVGSIAGNVDGATIEQCYWNKNTSYKAAGTTGIQAKASFPFDEKFTLNGKTSFVTTLNSYANSNKLSKWTHLRFNTSDLVFVPPALFLTKHYGLIATEPPMLAPPSEERDFLGWYMDLGYMTPYDANLVGSGEVFVQAKWFIYSSAIKIEFKIEAIKSEDIVFEIKRFMDCEDCFTVIEEFDDVGNGAMKVYFRSISEAKQFVRTLTEGSGELSKAIESVSYIEAPSISASVTKTPFRPIALTIISILFTSLFSFLL